MTVIVLRQLASGEPGDLCTHQLVSVLARESSAGPKPRRLQRQLRLETGTGTAANISVSFVPFYSSIYITWQSSQVG